MRDHERDNERLFSVSISCPDDRTSISKNHFAAWKQRMSYELVGWRLSNFVYVSAINDNLYSSPNIVRVIKSRRMRWAGHVARMGEGRGVYRVFVGKPEGRRPLGRPRRRWEDNIRMDLREVGCGCVEWMELPQDRNRWRAFVSAVMNLRVP